jgi:cell division transport system permease protein
MISKKKKVSSKDVSRQKRKNRRLLSFFRVIRYGTDSFIRNSWLSVAATAVMTITLLIIFTTFVAQNVLTDTINDLRNKVDMSIYLKTETTDDIGDELVAELKKLLSVKSADFTNSATAIKNFAEDNSSKDEVLDAIKEASNQFPATLRVGVKDINDTSQLQDFVDNNTLVKQHLNPDYPPSFAGDRRSTIENIGRAVQFAQKLGIAAGAVFIVISSLIIFNTIRMAIFNRKEEIQMMKLIGADKSFIRGPFLIESIMYGVIAAIIADGLGIWGIYSIAKTLTSYQINIQPTIDLVTIYAALVLVIMVVVGAIIGVISSLFATHKYLKI